MPSEPEEAAPLAANQGSSNAIERIDAVITKGAILQSTLRLFVPLALVATVIALAAIEILSSNIHSHFETEQASLTRAATIKLGSILSPPVRHISSLPEEKAIRAAINASTPEFLAGMADSFVTLVQRNPIYDQARWIDETGMERVRINKNTNNNLPIIVPDHELQDKYDRDYFWKAMHLKNGEIYISPMDLNIENGTIEIPHKPIIRFAVKVLNQQSEPRGIIIINILAQPLLDMLNEIIDTKTSTAMILNQDGFWLASQEPEDLWGFMFGHTETFATRFPILWQQINRTPIGQILDETGLWTWQTLSPDMDNISIVSPHHPSWLIVSHVTPETLDDYTRATKLTVALIVLPLLAILGIMAWLIATGSWQEHAALQAKIRAEATADQQKLRLSELESSQRTQATLSAIVDSTDDAVISKNLDGRITSWNSAATRLFGFSAEDMLDNYITLLIPPERMPEEQEIMERLRHGEVIRHFETIRLHKNGFPIAVSVTISPIRDTEGNIIGASKIARDITNAKKFEAELTKYRQNLEILVQKRTEELIEANNLLKAREKFITTVTDNIPSMVGYWDKDLKCRFANAAYARWLGLTPEQMLNRLLSDLTPTELNHGNIDAISRVLAGESQQFDSSMKAENGEDVFYFAHYIPDIENEITIGFFVLITDITSTKKAEIELRSINNKLIEALKEAKAAEQTKGQFLANMSHEIRTPMNAIVGFSQIILEDINLSEDSMRYAKTIMNSSQSLLAIINDILDISKLESGKFILEHVCFHLPNALNDILGLFDQSRAEKRLKLNLIYDDSLPLRVIGDPTRLRQIFLNLLSNSFKFTESGSIIIGITPSSRLGIIHFCIADTGIGMSPEQIKQIFQPFNQADPGTTRRFGGTGLGTTICRQIVHAMGGDIWVESELGKGSTFHFTIPLPEAKDTTNCLFENGHVETTHFTSPRVFKILLAEDIESNAILAMLQLRRQGHEVDWAKTGIDVVDMYQRSQYDLVLMDIMMPEMDGIQATQKIRTLEINNVRRITIIALTASVMPDEMHRFLTADMDCVETKPIDFIRLFMTMEKIVPAGLGQPPPTPLDNPPPTVSHRSNHHDVPDISVSTLLGSLLTALMNRTPDQANTLIDKLASQIPERKLTAIKGALKVQDFPLAISETRKLAARFYIDLESAP